MKKNLNCAGSYVDSPDLIRTRKGTKNAIHKKESQCF